MMAPIHAALERGEKLNIYFELADDSHLDSGALVEDLKAAGSVGLKHRSSWQHMALVTDKDWVRIGAGAFGWLAPGELRLFEPAVKNKPALGSPKPHRSRASTRSYRCLSAEVVRSRVPWLVQHDVVCAGNLQHDRYSEVLGLRLAGELGPVALELRHGLRQIVAHEGDRVLARVVVDRAFVCLMRRMCAYFTRPALEDQPPWDVGLLDVLPTKDVAEERASGRRVVRIDE